MVSESFKHRRDRLVIVSRDRQPSPASRAHRLLRDEIWAVRAPTTIAFLVLIASVIMTLGCPLVVRIFVDQASGGASERTLATISVGYLALALFAGLSRVAASYLGVRCGWHIADSLRIKMLRDAIISTPILDIEKRRVGETLEKVEGNADIVGRSIAESGFNLVGNVAVAAGAVGLMFLLFPIIGAGMSLLVVVVSFILNRLSHTAIRRWERARHQQAELFGFVGDALRARDDLIPLGQMNWIVARVTNALDQLYRTEGGAYIYGRAFWPLTQLFIGLAFGIGFGFGLQRLEHGAITIGALTAIYLYIDLLQRPLEQVSSQAGQLQKMVAVLAIIANTLDVGDVRASDTIIKTADLPDGPLSVKFDSVTFSYDDATVLHGVSFEVQPGHSLGIIGRTGAGKSTIINLLCGLAQPKTGRVTIGGVDASTVSEVEFANHVTVISQRAHVFEGTVRENVTLFDNRVSDELVWGVIGELNAASWVRDLPEQLSTRIGSGGRSLSEGEMQLLAGARALIRPYGLLLVDEGASRLDEATERFWYGLLSKVMRDRTVLVIAHRWSSLQVVDQVLSINNGHVTGILSQTEAASLLESSA